ncbi:hypothetical protein V7S43_013840 [Phytophthora oleae]|uniref:Uncharacterized protein n=1 Tax=Phytophthora oleae TaxID=2107226 RepID=A0ABD3F4B5_9STRA
MPRERALEKAHPAKRRRTQNVANDATNGRLTATLDFHGVWRELKASGWSSKPPRGLDNRFRYVLPGCLANGIAGTDYLLGEEAAGEVRVAVMAQSCLAVLILIYIAVALEGLVREMVPVLANCLMLVVLTFMVPVLANCLVFVVLTYVMRLCVAVPTLVVLTRVAAVETPVTNTSVRRTT